MMIASLNKKKKNTTTNTIKQFNGNDNHKFYSSPVGVENLTGDE